MSWKNLAGAKPHPLPLSLEQAEKKLDLLHWRPARGGRVAAAKGASNISILQRNSVHDGGLWRLVSMYDLFSVGFRDNAWADLGDEKSARAWYRENGSGWVDGCAAFDGRVMAASRDGFVYELVDGAWRTMSRGDETLFKTRRFFDVVFDVPNERLVLWGGDGRAANTTLFFADGKWRKAKKSSPKPQGIKDARFTLHFDLVHQRPLRVSGTDLSHLDGEVWRRYEAATEALVRAEVGERPLVVAATGERTLVIDPEAGLVWRLVENNLEQLAEIEPPPGLISSRVLRAAGAYSWKEFEPANATDWLYGFDADTNRLLAVNVTNDVSVCAYDLSSISGG